MEYGILDLTRDYIIMVQPVRLMRTIQTTQITPAPVALSMPASKDKRLLGISGYLLEHPFVFKVRIGNVRCHSLWKMNMLAKA